jgi:hypothetical protein
VGGRVFENDAAINDAAINDAAIRVAASLRLWRVPGKQLDLLVYFG